MNRAVLALLVPEPSPKVPLSFIVVTFVVSGLIAVAIVYFGIHGQLGGPIP
ncbi:MAG: hypothetical protein WB947_05870 [Thermoplasmata archaeon]